LTKNIPNSADLLQELDFTRKHRNPPNHSKSPKPYQKYQKDLYN